MPVVFNHVREIAVGAVPDTDPNSIQPGESQVLRLAKRVANGDKITTGHELYFEFLDAAGAPVVGPTVFWQTWFRDDQPQAANPGARNWVSMEACTTGAGAYEAYITEDVRNADLFVQVTQLDNPGATEKILVHVTEV